MSTPLTDHERAFLRALGGIHRSWSGAVEGAMKASTPPAWVADAAGLAVLKEALAAPQSRAALQALISQVLGGVLHSVLVTLDGDSNAPDTGDLRISAADGAAFRKFLHEYLYEFVPLPGDEG